MSAISLQLSGDAVIQEMRKQTDTVLLAFSRGKDSICAYLALRPYFKIVPYHMYLVPRLRFVRESLDYFEGVLGTKIHEFPKPSFYRMLNNFVFQPPERIEAIRQLRLPQLTHQDFENDLRAHLGLSDACYVATGVRATDTLTRRLSIMQSGAISHRKRQFFPVWDWNKERLLREITQSGIKLPIDYRWFGRTFDGLQYEWVSPLKRYAPWDYETIRSWFPLIDVELKRRECLSNRLIVAGARRA